MMTSFAGNNNNIIISSYYLLLPLLSIKVDNEWVPSYLFYWLRIDGDSVFQTDLSGAPPTISSTFDYIKVRWMGTNEHQLLVVGLPGTKYSV